MTRHSPVHRLDNWQTTLRKQYGKRDPAANPIGPEPMRDSRDVSTMPSESFKESRAPTADAEQKASLMDQDPQDGESKADRTESNENDLDGKERVDEGATKAAEGDKMDVDEPQLNEPDEIEERPESLDWRDLPMLTKLESMHTVMEWHFSSLQNNQPPRIRQVMKSDDEHGSWVRYDLYPVHCLYTDVSTRSAYRTCRLRCKNECVLAYWRYIFFYSREKLQEF